MFNTQTTFDTHTNWSSMLETPGDFSDDMFSNSYDNESEELLNDNAESTLKIIENNYVPSQIPSSLYDCPKGTFIDKNITIYPDSIQYDSLYRELPSRSIMLANIPENTTEKEMIYVINQFGDHESYDFSKIKEGIAIVNFYNLEDAERMRISRIMINYRQIVMVFGDELPVKDQKHPPNNGTIVVFHLPKSVSDTDILNQFSLFGRIRQIRHTPNKASQRFIEFYDKRNAEMAMKKLDKQLFYSNNKKSKITVEYSLPGSFRVNNAKFYVTKLPTIVRNKTANRVY